MKRSKVEILEERMTKAYEEYYNQMMALERSRLAEPPTGKCASCGALTPSMYDFDAHYLVDDERYLNLGNCPKRYNNGKLMPKLYSPWGGRDLWDEAHEENYGIDWSTKTLLEREG